MLGSVSARHRVATVQVHRPSAASASAVLMATWLGSPPGAASPTFGLTTTHARQLGSSTGAADPQVLCQNTSGLLFLCTAFLAS